MTGHRATPMRITRRRAIGTGLGAAVALMAATPAATARTAAPTAGSGDGLALTTLWSRGENGWVDFRVHAVDVTSAGTLLAFSEARVGTSADDGPKDLVL